MAGLNSIEGLASNLNTTDIINATITLERQPAVLMERRQAEKTQELSTFQAFSAKLLAMKAALRNINKRSVFTQASISISDDSKLSATSSGEIVSGSYALNILSLARNHQIASQGFDDPTDTIMGTGTISITMGERSATTITIDQGANSLVDIKKAINDAKMGVTASIINDGTSSKPYRLLLTANETGQKNTIAVASNLTGGENLDYVTSSFDAPEIIKYSSGATSQVALATTADYTGTTNRSYVFTVAGNGAQTVGAGNITLNWVDSSDPNHTGSIVIDQADKEIIGPDGLKLTFSDGELVAGDSFQVTAFAPLLQQASDARVAIGSSADGASPIVVTSSTNTFKDVIPGIELTVKNTTDASSGPVMINTGLDTAGITKNIEAFISAYNEVVDFINQQSSYNQDTGEGGVLLGDSTLLNVQSRLHGMLFNPIAGLDKELNTLSAVGVRVDADGKLAVKSSTKLTQALENDFERFVKLFVDSGNSSISGIGFISAPNDIMGGSKFDVDITQAATHGYLQAGNIIDPAASNIVLTDANNKIKLKVDGIVSDEITLTSRTYTSAQDLVNELQTRIDQDEKIGRLGVAVEWVDTGSGQGHIKMTSSSYGESSEIDVLSDITNAASADLGLSAANIYTGKDVAGTINGEKATGKGQVLTGDENNPTTAGLKLSITLDQSQIDSGIEGTITITKGLSSVLDKGLAMFTDSREGVLAARTNALEAQIDGIKKYVEDFDERLKLRREHLVRQWADFESILGQLQNQGTFLQTQLENINANFNQILGRNK